MTAYSVLSNLSVSASGGDLVSITLRKLQFANGLNYVGNNIVSNYPIWLSIGSPNIIVTDVNSVPC
jgi:hypothetical protein